MRGWVSRNRRFVWAVLWAVLVAILVGWGTGLVTCDASARNRYAGFALQVLGILTASWGVLGRLGQIASRHYIDAAMSWKGKGTYNLRPEGPTSEETPPTLEERVTELERSATELERAAVNLRALVADVEQAVRQGERKVERERLVSWERELAGLMMLLLGLSLASLTPREIGTALAPLPAFIATLLRLPCAG